METSADAASNLLKIIDQLRQAFPGMAMRKILEGPLAQVALGPLPEWSNRVTRSLSDTTTFSGSAFVLCTFQDKVSGDIMVVLQHRPKTNLLCGTGGGFQNADFTEATTYYPASDKGEQPEQAAAREAQEEIRTADDKAVLDLDPATFTLITAGNDYRSVAQGGLPVYYAGYHASLNNKQAAAITQHVKALSDPTYRKASFIHSKRETGGVGIYRLEDAAAFPLDRFAHPQEPMAIKKLHEIFYPQRSLITTGGTKLVFAAA